MGQSWDLIRPLLVSLGYIDVRDGVLHVRAKNLLLMSDIYNGSEKLHISDTHLKGENKQYFMCLGKPIFDVPRRQIEAIKKGKFVFGHIRSLKTIDYKLRMKLQEYAEKNEIVIRNEMTTLIEVNPDISGITTIDNVPNKSPTTLAILPSTSRLTEKNEHYISAVLLLDLRLYPRPY